MAQKSWRRLGAAGTPRWIRQLLQCGRGYNGKDVVLVEKQWRGSGRQIPVHVRRDVTSNDDSRNIWARQPGLGAGVDAVAMKETGCCGEATMDSTIIAVTVDDE